MNFRETYGIPEDAELKIMVPPQVMVEKMGCMPSIRFPIFGDHTKVAALREYVAANFKHEYRVEHWPFPGGNYSRGQGYDITVSGDVEDLVVLQFSA